MNLSRRQSLLLIAGPAAVLLATVVSLLVIWINQSPDRSRLFFWRPDLTAQDAAEHLQHGNPNWRDVRCRSGTDGWDYICAYSYSNDGRAVIEEIGVDVNYAHVTHRSAP